MDKKHTKKHILFLHSSSEMYGSDRSLLYLIKGLDKNKYKISIILPCEGQLADEFRKLQGISVDIYGIAVLRRKNLSIRGLISYIITFLKSYVYLKKIIKTQAVDVVYTNVSMVFPGAIAATFSRNCGSVWHIREIIKNKFEQRVVSFMVNHFSNIIIANSRATGEAMCKRRDKLRIVYNAVEIKKTSKVHTNKEDVYVGMAGRINRWKGQKLFVDLAEAVHRQCPNVKFKIAGSAYTGEEYMEKDLEKYIQEKHLSDRVELLGQVNNMDEFYDMIDVFVLPSIQPEPFGLVVIEAMEKRLPVIATKHGGPMEIIDNGENGFLVPYDNVEEMARICINLCNDWQFREAIGIKAQEKKRRLFSLDNTIKEIDDILSSI